MLEMEGRRYKLWCCRYGEGGPVWGGGGSNEGE